VDKNGNLFSKWGDINEDFLTTNINSTVEINSKVAFYGKIKGHKQFKGEKVTEISKLISHY
jgi:hypothetical protein